MRLKVYRKGLWPQRNHGDNAKGKKPKQTDRRSGKPRGSTQALSSQIPNTHTHTDTRTHAHAHMHTHTQLVEDRRKGGLLTGVTPWPMLGSP